MNLCSKIERFHLQHNHSWENGYTLAIWKKDFQNQITSSCMMNFCQALWKALLSNCAFGKPWGTLVLETSAWAY